jgi:hypothetical protein
MAEGDVTVFEEAKEYMLDGGWESVDDFKVAILDNTTNPAAADAGPTLGGYSQVGSAGSYTAGGISVGDLGTLVVEAGGVMTFDSTTNPSWPSDGSNDTDAYWGLIYNDTDGTDRAIAFVDLAGPKNMSSGSLTVTWAVTGIFTIT